MKQKICVLCNKVFTGGTTSKWCSDCRFVTFNCHTCGKEKTIPRARYERDDVSPTNILGKRNWFCSKPCAQRNMTKAAAKHRENFVIVTCPNCGKQNRRKKSDKKRVFCNRKCYVTYRRNHPEKYPSAFSNPQTHKKAMRNRERNGNNWVKKRMGPLHPNWKGGKIGYRGQSWGKQRQRAVLRDGFFCVVCGSPGDDVHHIIDFRHFGYDPETNRNDIIANHLDNLVYLCRSCHGKAHKNNNGIPKNRVKKAKKHFMSSQPLLLPNP